MPRERSVQSRIAEHRRFREQSRRRIRPSITLFLISVACVAAWAYFLTTSWWMVSAILAFTGGHVLVEIVNYRYHDLRLKALTNEKVAEGH